MKLLYSNILPLGMSSDQEAISARIQQEIANSDSIEIAVGYASKASLLELDRLVHVNQVLHITIIIGMYYIEGIPEAIYHTALSINQRWVNEGIGEIRLVRPFKYHGKLYAFSKDGAVKSAIIGSANLGVVKLEANNRRQYEVSSITQEPSECAEIASFIRKLQVPSLSMRIDQIPHINIIREENTSLSGIESVDRIPNTQVSLYNHHKTGISFELPIKVPRFSERHMDDNRHYTKSNINVSYAAPRSARKARDWYETQLTVSKKIALMEGYPQKNVPFFVVTDDGYMFKAHTTSDGNKQFSAVGDELILGRWIKGRLAAAGLVTPVNDTKADTDRLGMITQEMLQAYGCTTLVLSKTDQRYLDEDGAQLDIWMLSFQAPTVDGDN